MKDLTWGDALSVQIEEIDEDHKKLVELFNILPSCRHFCCRSAALSINAWWLTR